MTLWWCHDLFWWESLCMHLVNWAGIVTLNRDVEADALLTLFMKEEMVVSFAYHDTILQVPWCAPTLSQPGYVFIKTCKKKYNMYRNVWGIKNLNMYKKLQYCWVSIYTTSLGFWAEFTLISMQGRWHFRNISTVWYKTQIGKWHKSVKF